MDAIKWKNDHISVIDAIMLPEQEYFHKYINFREIGAAIEENIIYGYGIRAIAIAMALALTAERNVTLSLDKYREILTFSVDYFEKITGTSALYRTLFHTLRDVIQNGTDNSTMVRLFKEESINRFNQQTDAVKKIARNGVKFINNGDSILLFSAAGSSLATAGGGLVTSILSEASKHNQEFTVYVAESRPDFSGSRIMAWEMVRHGFSVTVIPDIQIRQALHSGEINKVMLAADAVHADGLFVGRSGIGMVAECAYNAEVPVYAVCPSYFFDESTTPGTSMENRAPITQVAFVKNTVTVPEGVSIRNFNTETIPPRYITALISDSAVIDNVENRLTSLFAGEAVRG
ncbi:MAG: hypothetical protein ACOC2H_02240 [Spirochaetota bacterium]